MDGRARVPILLALAAAFVRLAPLQWLHPLNWDELEFYRASRWIAEGLVPFRDFWEHHTPLAWFVYAPFTRLTDSPGANAILAMRWVQVPVWIAVFWLANLWMRGAGLSRFARWSAIALAVSSSLLMTSAVEFRLDPLACAFYMAGLVLWQRGTPRALFGAGAMFCLTGLTNMRLGPLLVLTVLLLCVTRERKWGVNLRAAWIAAGGLAALALALLYFVGTDSLTVLYERVITDNYVGDKYGEEFQGAFLHRLLVPFGIRVLASDRLFEWAAVDAGGIAILILGAIGIARALFRWRSPDEDFLLALLVVANLFVVARMHSVYNYHLQIVVIMLVPLIARVFDRIPRRGAIVAVLAVAWSVSAFASLFRGKELDLAYQDLVMREVHARTRPGERVFSGIPWALRREPAYRFWFMPDQARQLVRHGHAAPYALADAVRDAPAALVIDYNAMVWIGRVQRELAPYFVRHYIPVWRNLWVPGMNARLTPESPRAAWVVPRDGTYRVFASAALAGHEWFRAPFRVVSYENHDAGTVLALPPARADAVEWRIDGAAADAAGGTLVLRKGQQLEAFSGSAAAQGVIVLSSGDTTLFRQPPPGATLEAATTRVTHVPDFGARIEP